MLPRKWAQLWWGTADALGLLSQRPGGGSSSSSAGNTSMILVAYDTPMDPGKLRQKLLKNWGKQLRRFIKKKARKHKFAKVREVLQSELDIDTSRTGFELRDIGGQRLSIDLDTKHRAAFDEAFFELTRAPVKRKRPATRFKFCRKRAK